MVIIKEVIDALEQYFPPKYQEDWDNTGVQVGNVARPCSGVMVCVDANTDIVVEAAELRCNLIITHHPLIFRPLKSISNYNRVEMTIYKAIQNNIIVYSCHTSSDNTPGKGVSWKMAEMLGLENVVTLDRTASDGIGAGVVGDLPRPMDAMDVIAKIKSAFDVPVARCSRMPYREITRIALCGGAGAFLIKDAVIAGVQMLITSDTKHNEFIDYRKSIGIVDIGHYEAEKCTRMMFSEVLRESFPDLPVYISKKEINPITYI